VTKTEKPRNGIIEQEKRVIGLGVRKNGEGWWEIRDSGEIR
jgi:hypothetical protein